MAHPIDEIKRFMQLTPQVEAELRALMCVRTMKRGERIDGRAEMRNHVFYIEQGLARVFFYKNGRDETISFASDDEFIVMNRTLLTDPDVVVNIEFLERSQVIYMPHMTMKSKLELDNEKVSTEALPFFVTGLLNHISDLEERNLVLQNHSARQRYEWMEQRYPRIVERASIPQIASFLGLTKETLYRIRSNKYSAK